jgi:D-alanyl-D-alanine carboxypeptidase
MKTSFFSILIGITAIMSTFPLAGTLPLNTHKPQPGTVNLITDKQKSKLQLTLDEYAAKGLPGIAIAIKSGNEEWTGTSGFATVENKDNLTARHLMYSQSVAKTYMAVVILKLEKQKKIKLNDPITKYLPTEITSKIEQSDKITVRMLLNHDSGIYDYAYDSAYVQFLVSQQKAVIKPEVMLSYVYPHKNVFAPGTSHAYSNTNYLLLALIADSITGDHAAKVREMIKEAGLKNTFYREKNYLDNPLVVSSYLDMAENGQFSNVSALQKLNVASMIGDDGIVATPLDYARFFDALMHNKILSEAQMKIMLARPKSETPVYGMGISHMVQHDVVGYGHSGGGLGAGCIVYYFPEKDVTVFMGVNFSTLRNGPHTLAAYEMISKVMKIVLKPEDKG